MSVIKKIDYITYPKTKGTEFGDPTWVKYGKEERVQDYIEANKTDTEIYECLEKYGCLKPLEMNYEGTYADFTEMNDLRSSLEKMKKANEMWAQVPADIKKQFNNDIHEFVDRGMEWVEGEIKKAQQSVSEPTPTKTTEPQGE